MICCPAFDGGCTACSSSSNWPQLEQVTLCDPTGHATIAPQPGQFFITAICGT